jgi:glutamyl-tRNA synthetase
MGYPAAGMRNYLTRLGWAHGDAEIFTSEEAMGMFDLVGNRSRAGAAGFQEAGKHLRASHGDGR